MFKPGIFTMHDFHVYRLYEYDKCIADVKLPCRWAPDSAFEYGEPVFNYYAQLPYLFGEVFRFLGLSVLGSIKALFVSSLVFSALAMFFLARQLWGNNLAALTSALVYTYAPYRAVDVWVRGALPESLAFIFFPLITYFFNDFVLKKKTISLLLFGLSFSALVLTHNLSVFMFLIFFSIWAVYFLTKHQSWKLVPQFIGVGIISFGLSAFYILPVIFENKLVTLTETTGGYYDFKNHYVTLNQLLISRYWGYGASLWGEDDRLSLSVGHVQWVIPILIAVLVIFRRKIKNYFSFFVLFGLGWFMLFLTHNKSTPLWDIFAPLRFVQFPWRFLGSAVFIFALSTGALLTLFKKPLLNILISLIVIGIVIGLNTPFYFEDIWQSFDDKQFFSGKNYEMQVGSAIYDFWPKTAGKEVPSTFAPKDPIFKEGSGSGKLIEKKSHSAKYELEIKSNQAEISFPIVYFSGWVAYSNDQKLEIYPKDKYGLITTRLIPKDKIITLEFKDTLVRQIGNTLTLISLFTFISVFTLLRRKEKK